MSTDPDQLRAEIDRTRSALSNDVDALTEHVAPANVAQRQADKVKGAVGDAASSVKDRIMGTAHDAHDRASSATGAVGGAAGSLGDAASDTPAKLRSQTRGNPMAAGLIALGAGWLIGSLIPVSAKEQQAAVKVKENAGTLTAPVTAAAKDIAETLREPAQEAVAQVKETATDAAATVKDEGAGAARHVQDEARDSRDQVRDQA